MDQRHREDYLRSLTPDDRLKAVIAPASSVEVDSSIPPRMYYRSGNEIVRMAYVYMEEGSLENAYILCMKFITLFVEKIRNHPEFDSVPASLKALNTQKLREVFPKAEKLKQELLAIYKEDYERFLVKKRLAEEERRRREEAATSAAASREAARGRVISVVPPPPTSVAPVPPLDLAYPDLLEPLPPSALVPRPRSTSPNELAPITKARPVIERSTKPGRLRPVTIPEDLMVVFLSLAQPNTETNIETCAILAGKLRRDELVVTHVLVPEQSGTPDSCTTRREEEIFDYQDQHDLITIGWIHTHPSQTAFLSSVDLHTHYSYQRMMPEAIAIVCAPKYNEYKWFCLTPDHGLPLIGACRLPGFHPHPSDLPLFMECEHCRVVPGGTVIMKDLRR